jgi:chemotaxis protein CheC
MNRLGEIGIEGVEHRLQWLSNYNDTVESELIKGGYVDTNALDGQFQQRELLGGRVKLPDVPYGYALILFPVESADNAAALMLESTVDDLGAVASEMARSALTELSGIMVNGFFDAWANRFDQDIALSEPEAVHNTEREILRSTIGGIDAFGIYVISVLALPEHAVKAQLYLFPDDATFIELLNRVDMDVIA